MTVALASSTKVSNAQTQTHYLGMDHTSISMNPGLISAISIEPKKDFEAFKKNDNMEKKKKIFVSIPMSGVENTVLSRYRRTESKIKADEKLSEYEIVAPYKFFDYFTEDGVKGDCTSDIGVTAFCMGKDIELVIGCDAIYSCDGWEESKGCRVERYTANVYGLEMYNE